MIDRQMTNFERKRCMLQLSSSVEFTRDTPHTSTLMAMAKLVHRFEHH